MTQQHKHSLAPSRVSQNGFTFLEMIITLAIMATLTVASNQSIQNALRAKLKLQEQLDDMSRVRDALRVIERDINLAYHYQDIETEFKKVVQQEANKSGQPQAGAGGGNPAGNPPPGGWTPQTPQPQQPVAPGLAQWLKPDPDRVDPTTHFIGTGEDMYFATMNAGRISADVPQADFIKVGYYLTSCPRKKEKEIPTGKCLVRRSSNIVEGDITKGGVPTLLLENVTELKFRYIGKGKQDWNSDWNTKDGDGVTKDSFPESVEISVTTTKESDSRTSQKPKKISMQLVASVHFPNNKVKENSGP